MSMLKYWVWLSAITGIRSTKKNELLDHFGDPEGIYFAPDAELLQFLENKSEQQALRQRGLEKAEYIIERCHALGVHLLTQQDAIYPERLRHIYDPPIVLYVRGNLPVLDAEAAIALVGTRRCTPYGVKMALQFGYEITKYGGLLVSGLAAGIDGAGAKGALRAGGSCVGVLGTAIDEVYPRENEKLFQDVLSCGALISEYYPGYPLAPGNFPMRNRILSGISCGVLLIEAPKHSGALITANRALEQGRDVFVVPGNLDAPASAGSNALMKDAAKPVVCVADILEEYTPLFPDKMKHIKRAATAPNMEHMVSNSLPEQVSGKTNIHVNSRKKGKGAVNFSESSTKKVIDKDSDRDYIDLEKVLAGLSEMQLKIVAVMEAPSMHVDDIIEKSALPTATVLSELTMMEISGIVLQEPGKRFSLNLTVQ